MLGRFSTYSPRSPRPVGFLLLKLNVAYLYQASFFSKSVGFVQGVVIVTGKRLRFIQLVLLLNFLISLFLGFLYHLLKEPTITKVFQKVHYRLLRRLDNFEFCGFPFWILRWKRPDLPCYKNLKTLLSALSFCSRFCSLLLIHCLRTPYLPFYVICELTGSYTKEKEKKKRKKKPCKQIPSLKTDSKVTYIRRTSCGVAFSSYERVPNDQYWSVPEPTNGDYLVIRQALIGSITLC